MAVLCRQFGISRKTGYKVRTRYNDIGLEGLTAQPGNNDCQNPIPIG
jgi:transposase